MTQDCPDRELLIRFDYRKKKKNFWQDEDESLFGMWQAATECQLTTLMTVQLVASES